MERKVQEWSDKKAIIMTTKKIIKLFKKANTATKLMEVCVKTEMYQCLFIKDSKKLYKACINAHKKLGIKVTKEEKKNIKRYFKFEL